MIHPHVATEETDMDYELVHRGRRVATGSVRDIVAKAESLGCPTNIAHAERLLVRDGTLSFSRPNQAGVWIGRRIRSPADTP